jgi:hypothetical protein
MKYLFYCLFSPPPVYILHPPLRFSALSPPARFGFGVELFLVHDLIEVAYLKHLSTVSFSCHRLDLSQAALHLYRQEYRES